MCGETSLASNTEPIDWGLSPRVRGNLFTRFPPWCRSRSIPACAGKPLRDSIASAPRIVYAFHSQIARLTRRLTGNVAVGYLLIVLHYVYTVRIHYLLGSFAQGTDLLIANP